MKTKKETAWEGANEVQTLLYRAIDSYTIETAVKNAMNHAADLFYQSTGKVNTREARAYIKLETVNILEDTIARLQKVCDLAKKDGRIFWQFPGTEKLSNVPLR